MSRPGDIPGQLPAAQPVPPLPVTLSAHQPLSPTSLPIPPGLVPTAGVEVPGLVPTTGSIQAAMGLAQAQMRDTTVLVAQAKVMSGEIEKDFGKIRKHVQQITGAMEQTATTVVEASRQTGRHRVSDTTVHTPLPRPVDAEAVSQGAVPTTAQMAGDYPEAREQPPLQGFGFAAGRHQFSLSQVGMRASSAAARHLQTGLGGYELTDTGWRRAGEGRHSRVSPMTGRVLGVASQAQRALGRIAGGEAISSALPGIGRLAGPVGFATGAVSMVAHQMEQQRDLNRNYQQITGGSNASITDPLSGLRQRIGETGFQASMFGTMGGSQARELYHGIAETGLEGGSRQAALGFAVEQYRKWGTDISDTVQMIQMSVRNGVTEFGSLNEALTKVSKSARDAGQNVQVVQRSFEQTLGAVQQQVTGGAAAPTIAGAIQSELTKQGRTLSGQLDFSGMLTQRSLTLQAGALGMAPAAYTAAIQDDTALMGKGLQSQVDRVRDAVFGPDALSFAHGEAQKAMKLTGGQLTPGDAANIGRELAKKGMLNPMQFMAVAASMGMGGVTQANVYEVAAKVALGSFRFDKALSSQASGLPDQGRTVDGQKIMTYGDLDAAVRGGDVKGAAKLGAQGKMLAQAVGKGGLDELDKSGRAYVAGVQEAGAGRRSAVLEAMLRDESSLKGRHFVVQGPNGPLAVTFDQAFKQYRDQLSRGDVVVQETGETVSQTTGKMGDRGVPVTSSSQKAPKGAGAPTQAPAGSVAIYPTDELRRILRFQTQGGAYIDSAQRQGVPAAPFPGAPQDYPSATGH